MNPINFSFVEPINLDITHNGEAKTLTILTLDKEANDAYWKQYHCFSEQINKLKLNGPEECDCWEMSIKFIENEGVSDFLNEVSVNTGDVPTLYQIPIKLIDNDEPYLALKLKDGRTEVNTYWK